jgi:hypothetical protein
METTNVFMNWVTELSLDLDTISKYVDRGASPGKVLRKEILKRHPQNTKATPWLDCQVSYGVHALSAKQYAERIEFLEGEEVIGAVYDDPAVKSCMTGEGAVCGPFYARNGMSLAVMRKLTKEMKVVARAVVHHDANEREESYGPSSQELGIGLRELGYQMLGGLTQLKTCMWIPKVKGEIMIPYLDGGNRWFFPLKDREDEKGLWAIPGFVFTSEDVDMEDLVHHVHQQLAKIKQRDDLCGYAIRHQLGHIIEDGKTIYYLKPVERKELDWFLNLTFLS